MKQKSLFGFLLLIFAVNVFAQQVNINPSIINFHLDNPGAIETKTLSITNNSDEVQVFEINMGDWIRKDNGDHQYFEPNTKPFSCANWVKINKNFIEVGPKATEELIITLQAPEDQEALESMRWAMLFIQGAVVKKPQDQDNANVNAVINEIVRVGIHIYQTPFNLSSKEIKAIALNPNPEEANVYDFSLENTGSTMVIVKTHVELTNVQSGEEVIAPKAEFPIFPGAKRIVQMELPQNLKPGKYSLLAIADYGEDNPLEAIEKVIEIK
jgi:hypothetical protein